MFKLKQPIEDSSTNSSNLVMAVAKLNDWKHLPKAFKALHGIMRNFFFEIHIYVKQEEDRRMVYVDVFNCLLAQVSDKRVNLLWPGH